MYCITPTRTTPAGSRHNAHVLINWALRGLSEGRRAHLLLVEDERLSAEFVDLVAHVLSALFVLCDLGVQLIDRLLLLIMRFSKVRQLSDMASRLIQCMQMMQKAYRAKTLFQIFFDGRQLHIKHGCISATDAKFFH